MPAVRPSYVVLDTNVLLRIIVLDFGTREAIGIPAIAQAADIKLVLAPHQEDEFWRNASDVLSEHDKKWKDIVRDTKKTLNDLIINMKACDALGVLDEQQQTFLNDLGAIKQNTDQTQELDIQWDAFEQFAENNLSVIREMTEHISDCHDNVWQKAIKRIELFNPPCNDKKKRWLGDCAIWELLLALLEMEDGPVWFASTDADYSDNNDVHTLHRFLNREVEQFDCELAFYHEDRSLGLTPGPRFKILEALTEVIPDHITGAMRKAIDSFNAISPDVSWFQLDEAMNKLNYRERQILKLRLGWAPYNEEYTQTEVARIFKLSQPRISQIEGRALHKLRDMLSDSATEEIEG